MQCTSLSQLSFFSHDITAPFPGYGWLSRISSEGTQFEHNGKVYSSAYDAMLYGDPAQHACRNFNCWVNALIISPHIAAWLSNKVGIEAAHYVLCYFRNLLGGVIIYYGTAAAFSYHIYVAKGDELFKNRKRPTPEVMWDQIKLAQASLFLYVLLPVLDEYLIEQGYTRVYYTVDEIGGLGWHVLAHVAYFSLVEIGIYWMHRTLHTNKFLYKHVHMLHHKYNRPDTLTPWASIAFHPLDGMLQASPYVICLPFVPCHYVTHVCMLFFTAIWATVCFSHCNDKERQTQNVQCASLCSHLVSPLSTPF
jgi:lathosterol oxidase